MLDVKQLLSDCEERMDMSVMHLEETLGHIRAGKANIHILDPIRVNSYGSMVPINNCAAITTPDARTIAIKPWDKSMFRVIEKALIDSTIGIDIETTSGSTGFVFIKLWSIILFFLPFHIKSRTASEHNALTPCGEKDALSKIRARSPGFCSGSC